MRVRTGDGLFIPKGEVIALHVKGISAAPSPTPGSVSTRFIEAGLEGIVVHGPAVLTRRAAEPYVISTVLAGARYLGQVERKDSASMPTIVWIACLTVCAALMAVGVWRDPAGHYSGDLKLFVLGLLGAAFLIWKLTSTGVAGIGSERHDTEKLHPALRWRVLNTHHVFGIRDRSEFDARELASRGTDLRFVSFWPAEA